MSSLAARPRRVVVADDEPSVRRFVASVLARYPQLAVEYHETGTDALVALRRGGLDMLIVGANLPGLDALELCQCARADFPHAGRVLISATKVSLPAADGLVHRLIVPPFSPNKLAPLVRKIL